MRMEEVLAAKATSLVDLKSVFPVQAPADTNRGPVARAKNFRDPRVCNG